MNAAPVGLGDELGLGGAAAWRRTHTRRRGKTAPGRQRGHAPSGKEVVLDRWTTMYCRLTDEAPSGLHRSERRTAKDADAGLRVGSSSSGSLLAKDAA
jgi:hypothetical protein